MWALFVATVYFGTFLVIGWVAKRVLDRWMDQRGVELSEVQKQAGHRGAGQPAALASRDGRCAGATSGVR